MANLLITVIAIGLVALLALTGVYYGGGYYTGMTANAEASTFLSVGNQVQHAWQAYTNDHNGAVPTSWASLVSGGYLLSRPMVPAQAGGGPPILAVVYQQANGYWLWYLLGRPGVPTTANDPLATACLKVVKLVTGKTATMPQSFGFVNSNFASSLSGNGIFGCAQYNATASPPQNITGNPLSEQTGSYAAGYDYIGFYKLN